MSTLRETPRRPALAVAAFVCGLAATGGAQFSPSVVVPAAQQFSEASGLAFWAFSPFKARRQVLITQNLLTPVRWQLIRSITVRRNAGDNDPLQGGRVDLEVWMSDNANNPWSMSATFASNRGPSHRQVFNGSIELPDTGASPVAPAPWSPPYIVTIQLSEPFFYTGGPLCIETVTRDSTSPPWWPIDAAVERSLVGSIVPFGTSCLPGASVPSAGADPGSVTVAATATFHLRGATPVPGAAVSLFGTNNVRYGSAKLPFSLTPLGAPGCTLYTDVFLAVPATIMSLPSSPLTLATASVEIPPWQWLNGTVFYNQWIVLDPTANPLGVVLSNGVSATIGPSKRRNIGWLESGDLAAPRGQLMPGRAPVLWIRS